MKQAIDAQRKRNERAKKAEKVRKEKRAKKIAERRAKGLPDEPEWNKVEVFASDDFRSFYSTLCAGNAEDPNYDFLSGCDWFTEFINPIKRFFPRSVCDKTTINDQIGLENFELTLEDLDDDADLDDLAAWYRTLHELVDKMCMDNGAVCIYCTKDWASCDCSTCEYCGCVEGDCKRNGACEE